MCIDLSIRLDMMDTRRHRPHPQAFFQTGWYNRGFIEEGLNRSQGICFCNPVSTMSFKIELRFREPLEMMYSNSSFHKKPEAQRVDKLSVPLNYSSIEANDHDHKHEKKV